MLHMQQTYSSREAADALAGDVDSTTIQRAIQRGELAAAKAGKHRQSPFKIAHADLLAWAAARGYSFVNGNGDRVDAATGEVLESEPSPAARAVAARQRLNGVAPALETDEAAAPDAEPAAAPVAPRVESNVARVLLPGSSVAADRLALLTRLVKAGHLDAAQLVIEAWES